MRSTIPVDYHIRSYRHIPSSQKLNRWETNQSFQLELNFNVNVFKEIRWLVGESLLDAGHRTRQDGVEVTVFQDAVPFSEGA